MRNIALLSVVALFLAACVTTVEDFAQSWVGEPVSDLIEAKHKPDSYAAKIGWKEQRYDLRNGNWVYVSPSKEGCLVHWEVNPRGIIVGYHTEGNLCD